MVFCPDSPSCFSAFSFGVEETKSCTIIDEVIYGIIVNAKIDILESEPPESMLNIPKTPVLVYFSSSPSIEVSIHGRGMNEPKR